MNIKILFLILIPILFLTSCNQGSSSTSSQSSVADVYLRNTNTVTKIAPTEYFNSQNTYGNEQFTTSLVSSAASTSTMCSSSNNYYSQSFDIDVSTLQSIYNDHFCQLNQALNITMNTPQCQSNISFIKDQADTGYFNLNASPIQNNALGISSVNFTPMNYTTTVPLPSGNQTFNVSGALIMPNIDKTKIKGVAVYFHGTTFNKVSVGSNWCNSETQLVAAIFASQGYIVVMPDYVGQGANWQSAHPYVLYPKVSAKTAIDMLSSVMPTIQSKYSLSNSDSIKLFSFGYSEGGAYSLWFNTFLRENPSYLSSFYNLTHSVGAEGAYNISNVIKGFLFSDVSASGTNTYNIQSQALTNSVKPLLSADALLSYATYSVNNSVNGTYDTNTTGYLSIFNTSFFNMDCSPQSMCNYNGAQMNIANAFAQQNTTVAQQILASALGKSNTISGVKYTYPEFLILYSSENNVSALVSESFFNASQMSQLDSVMQAADVNLSSVPNGAVSIISLTQDSVVSPNNYTYLSTTYPSKFYKTITINPSSIQVRSLVAGSSYVDYINVDHMQALIYEYLYILNIFNNK